MSEPAKKTQFDEVRRLRIVTFQLAQRLVEREEPAFR